MRKLILIISLIPFAANSQTMLPDTIYFGTAPNFTRVTFYRNQATTTIAPMTAIPTVSTKLNISDTSGMLLAYRNSINGKQPVGSYALATDNLTGVTALSSGTQTITINKALYTVTPAAAMTLNATGGIAGQRFTIVVTTSGTTSRVITFGTGFRSVGTLATGTVTAKIFSVSFINIDGVTNVETGRTIGQ